MAQSLMQKKDEAKADTANAGNKSLQKKRINDAALIKDNRPVQKRPNHTGMPDKLKAGVEALSGMSMDHVRVHYNSDKPAQLQAHAYAQGNQIHLAPGQEKHLPHEAWHVVQQAQGRVRPTMQMKKGVSVNDDQGLEHEADVMGMKAIQMAADGKSSLRPTIAINESYAPSQIARGDEVAQKNRNLVDVLQLTKPPEKKEGGADNNAMSISASPCKLNVDISTQTSRTSGKVKTDAWGACTPTHLTECTTWDKNGDKVNISLNHILALDISFGKYSKERINLGSEAGLILKPLNKDNSNDAKKDLTPDEFGRAPRHTFFSKTLVEQHEGRHAEDSINATQRGLKKAQVKVNAMEFDVFFKKIENQPGGDQNKLNDPDKKYSTFLCEEVNKIIKQEDLDDYYGNPPQDEHIKRPGEIRTYGAMKWQYDQMATKIAENAIRLGWTGEGKRQQSKKTDDKNENAARMKKKS